MSRKLDGRTAIVTGAAQGIGKAIATRLAAAGNEVSVVVRGAHLEAIRAAGLTLLTGDRKIVMPVKASDNPADLGPQAGQVRIAGEQGRKPGRKRNLHFGEVAIVVEF